MAWILIILCALLTAGCYVNRAVVDPFSYAPGCPSWNWDPDARAKCINTTPCTNLHEDPTNGQILSLAEVLDLALINNTATQITWAKAREAAALYGKSQSSAFPKIRAEYFYTTSRTAFLSTQVEPDTGRKKTKLFTSDQSTWGPQSHVDWILFDFGQRRYTSEAARYALYFADYTHNQAIQTVFETITLDYYNYLAQVKLLEANEVDLADTKVTLNQANVGLESGVKNISDVLQARTQTLLAEIQLSEQHRAVKEAYAVLLTDMGLPASLELQFQSLPFVDPELTELDTLENYLEVSMENRPEVLAARANVVSARMSLNAAKREWTPVLNYHLDLGRTNFSGGFSDDIDYTSTFSLSMPIFTGFSIRNTIKLNEAKLAEASATLQQTELSTIREVTTAHYNVNVAYNTLKAAICLMRAAKEQYEVAMSQYKDGVNSILDVVSAQTALFDARAKEAEATRQWFTALTTLAYSAGILSYNMENCP